MTFFFWEITVLPKEKLPNRSRHQALACLFGNHAEAQADLSMAIDGRPNAVLMPGLDCFPNGPVWTSFANFQQASVGSIYFGLVCRYHFRRKLEENLATLYSSIQIISTQTKMKWASLGFLTRWQN